MTHDTTNEASDSAETDDVKNDIQVNDGNDASPEQDNHGSKQIPEFIGHFVPVVDNIRNIGFESCSSENVSMTDDSINSTAPLNDVNVKKIKVRYPGDIDENRPMSPNTVTSNFRLCKNKIKIQAKQIYHLKRKVKRQQEQISTLRELLRKLKVSFSLSEQAVQSIEVI